MTAPRHQPHPRNSWARLVRRYGWRAYAVPILAVITVIALVRTASSTPVAGDGALRHDPAKAPAQHTSVQHSPARGGTQNVQVEGFAGNDSGFRAGATPPPISVSLGSDSESCVSNTYGKLVLVSISQQHMWVCARHRQVRSTPVTTGKVTDHDQTPLGSWRVQAKQRNRYLVGPGYRDYVKYWVPFNGDFGLHDASWQTMPFGSSHWRTQGSHGCVHTPTPVMKWLYGWVVVGSTVVTIEH